MRIDYHYHHLDLPYSELYCKIKEKYYKIESQAPNHGCHRVIRSLDPGVQYLIYYKLLQGA